MSRRKVIHRFASCAPSALLVSIAGCGSGDGGGGRGGDDGGTSAAERYPLPKQPSPAQFWLPGVN